MEVLDLVLEMWVGAIPVLGGEGGGAGGHGDGAVNGFLH